MGQCLIRIGVILRLMTLVLMGLYSDISWDISIFVALINKWDSTSIKIISHPENILLFFCWSLKYRNKFHIAHLVVEDIFLIVRFFIPFETTLLFVRPLLLYCKIWCKSQVLVASFKNIKFTKPFSQCAYFLSRFQSSVSSCPFFFALQK